MGRDNRKGRDRDADFINAAALACLRKRRFSSEESVRSEVERLRLGRIDYYRCGHCDGWHLTSYGERKRRSLGRHGRNK